MSQTIHSKPLPVISIDFGNKSVKIVGKNKGIITTEGIHNGERLTTAIKISYQGFDVFPSDYDPSDKCSISNIKEGIGEESCTFEFAFT